MKKWSSQQWVCDDHFLMLGLEPKTFGRNTDTQPITELHEYLKFPGIPLQKGESFEPGCTLSMEETVFWQNYCTVRTNAILRIGAYILYDKRNNKLVNV